MEFMAVLRSVGVGNVRGTVGDTSECAPAVFLFSLFYGEGVVWRPHVWRSRSLISNVKVSNAPVSEFSIDNDGCGILQGLW